MRFPFFYYAGTNTDPGRRAAVESTRANSHLTAIPAAVVGVIASLALFFGRHVSLLRFQAVASN